MFAGAPFCHWAEPALLHMAGKPQLLVPGTMRRFRDDAPRRPHANQLFNKLAECGIFTSKQTVAVLALSVGYSYHVTARLRNRADGALRPPCRAQLVVQSIAGD